MAGRNTNSFQFFTKRFGEKHIGVYWTQVTKTAWKVLLGLKTWSSVIVRPALLGRHEKAGDSHQKSDTGTHGLLPSPFSLNISWAHLPWSLAATSLRHVLHNMIYSFRVYSGMGFVIVLCNHQNNSQSHSSATPCLSAVTPISPPSPKPRPLKVDLLL